MSPSPWARKTGFEGWARSFLHGTWLGRKIVRGFWIVLGEDVISLTKLRDHPETKKLLPWRGGFEVSNCLSIHNYPTSIFDLIREGRIKIEIDEVQSLEAEREVVLKSGAKINVDAVVCATGWEVSNSLQFKPDGLDKELGLPTVSTKTLLHPAAPNSWATLITSNLLTLFITDPASQLLRILAHPHYRILLTQVLSHPSSRHKPPLSS
jgi:hypothetical protein